MGLGGTYQDVGHHHSCPPVEEFMLRPAGLTELWKGPGVGRGIVPNLSGMGECLEDRGKQNQTKPNENKTKNPKQAQTLCYTYVEGKKMSSSQYGDP